MNRKNAIILAIIALGALYTACSVSFSDPVDGDGIFPCECNDPKASTPCESDDCIGGDQSCKQGNGGKKVCLSESIVECTDEDGDGYGTNSDLSECPACKNGELNGCTKDCNDNDAEVNPGRAEDCNGKDDNCDGKTDGAIGAGECMNSGTCPLAGAEPQSGTSFKCKTINGTSQCILQGLFTTDSQCTMQSGWGLCQNNSWTKVPSKCTMAQ